MGNKGVNTIAVRLRNDNNVCFGKESIAQGFSPELHELNII